LEVTPRGGAPGKRPLKHSLPRESVTPRAFFPSDPRPLYLLIEKGLLVGSGLLGRCVPFAVAEKERWHARAVENHPDVGISAV
jgi:hypothetical protein